jgi:hypothetical protein
MTLREKLAQQAAKILGHTQNAIAKNKEKVLDKSKLGVEEAAVTEEDNFENIPIEAYTEEGLLGGDGDPNTGTLNATLYFVLDTNIADPTGQILQTYINNFQQSVAAVWTTFFYGTTQVNLGAVQFLPLDNTMNASNVRHNLFVVGNGLNDPRAGAPRNDTTGTSYVTSGQFLPNITLPVAAPNTWGYFYYQQGPIINYAAHEFGHIFGLTDRYHQGVWNNNTPSNGDWSVTGRVTIPMFLNPSIDSQYDPLNNLYSNGNPVVTQMQLRIVFNRALQPERTYPTIVLIVPRNQNQSATIPIVVSVNGGIGVRRVRSNAITSMVFNGDARQWQASLTPALQFVAGGVRNPIPVGTLARLFWSGRDPFQINTNLQNRNRQAILSRF